MSNRRSRKSPAKFERQHRKPAPPPAQPTPPPWPKPEVIDNATRHEREQNALRLAKEARLLWRALERNPYDDEVFAAYKQAIDVYEQAHLLVLRARPLTLNGPQYGEYCYNANVFTPEWHRAILMLDRGDPIAFDEIVRFFEADPYVFRSGYYKDWLIYRICKVDIPEQYASRLRSVAMMVVDKADGRREFRAYCKLARKVDSPGLREDLRARLIAPSERVARFARWMIEALERKDRGS